MSKLNSFLSPLSLAEWFDKNFILRDKLDYILRVSPGLDAHIDIVKIALSHLSQNGRVLDLGCGDLDKLLPLAALGYQCTGVDGFFDADRFALVEAMAERHKVELVKSDLSECVASWRLGMYDYIMLNDVIEHLCFSPVPLLEACMEHLNPGGILQINVPSAVNLKKRFKCLIGSSIYPPAAQFFEWKGIFRGHIREYTRQDCDYLGKRMSGVADYSIASKSYMLGVIPPASRFAFSLIARIMPSLQDSWQLLITKKLD